MNNFVAAFLKDRAMQKAIISYINIPQGSSKNMKYLVAKWKAAKLIAVGHVHYWNHSLV